MDKFLKLHHITKNFPGVLANDRIDLEIGGGEIHALLGENGAGKTTLMNILFGLYKQDSGDIYIDGHKVSIRSPKDALDKGIGMVHQHFMLVPTMTVIENIILGREPTIGPIIKLEKSLDDITHMMERYKFNVPLQREVWKLSVGEQQRVEILKLLYRDTKIMILDEPTAVLAPPEVEVLFNVLRGIAQEGKSVIFISHKLKEVMELCEKVTILRKGRVIATTELRNTTQAEIANLMIGHGIEIAENITARKKNTHQTKPTLSLQNVTVKGNRDVISLKDVSFDIYPGEILGIAGVDGNGQPELAEVICGLRAIESGKMLFKEKDLGSLNPFELSNLGVWYVPADRKNRGSLPALSLVINSTIKNHRWQPFSNKGFLHLRQMREYTKRIISEYNVQCPSINVNAGTLSGGNLQKLILARETAHETVLLVAEQPTRGLDVGASHFVREKLSQMRQEGTSILLISADLDEVLSMSDRVIVFFNGEALYSSVIGEVNMEELSLAMTGYKQAYLNPKSAL